MFLIFWCMLLGLLSGGGDAAQSGLFAESTPKVASDANRQAAEVRVWEQSAVALCAIVEAGYLPDLRWPNFAAHRAEVEKFYQPVNCSLAWVRDSEVTPQGLALIDALQDVASHGLLAEDYDGPRWSERMAALRRSQPRPTAADWARFDVALTVSAMRYISDLRGGRGYPDGVSYGFYSGGTDIEIAEFLRQRLVEARDIRDALNQLQPPFPGYRRTAQALEAYSRLARQDNGELLPAPLKTVKPGDRYDGVPRLVRLLHLVGDLPPDSTATTADTKYDEPLVAAVKRFQRRHGLEPDGLIGPRTLGVLNTPLTHRVLQLQLALERWRWLPREFAHSPIIVNIPEFGLHAYDQQLRPALSMKVVVGQAYKHETPVFASEMKQVIFRPPWNVPLSIQIREIVPAIIKDPEYLLRGNYEITDRSGYVVSDGKVSELILRGLRSGNLALRQRPGPDNSLGLVKFVIPNDHDVYLHGTPAMSLFSRSRRDFSHGCIRVEDPTALAAWVLQDQPEWMPERIRAAMNATQTVAVSLTQPIPVMILYTTAVVMEDGEVRFFEDIYQQDAALADALAQRHSTPE